MQQNDSEAMKGREEKRSRGREIGLGTLPIYLMCIYGLPCVCMQNNVSLVPRPPALPAAGRELASYPGHMRGERHYSPPTRPWYEASKMCDEFVEM